MEFGSELDWPDLSPAFRAESLRSVDVDLIVKSLHDKIRTSMAKMEITNPQVLRVTPAYCAFQHCAMPFRSAYGREMHHKSRRSRKISTFWSHSWHGERWKKIATLVTFYNGRAASCAGTIVALLVTLLHSFGFLPGIIRINDWPGAPFSTWAIFCGFMVTSLCLVFWRPHSPVFFDRICISEDEKMKFHAIQSLAGLLKHSDKMLVIWDPSWTERLWCLFELAAFLKSQASSDQVLLIKPTVMGGLSIGIFCTMFFIHVAFTTMPMDSIEVMIIPTLSILVLGLAAGYPMVSAGREYFRSLDVMEEQLLSISFDTTKSSCCNMDHVLPSGARIMCDREIVKDCVTAWFGSQEEFEKTVRVEVLSILRNDLTERAFTREWVIGVTLPALWADMDMAASYARMERWDSAVAFLLFGLVFCFIMVSPTKDLMLEICRLFRHKRSTPCREVLHNVMVLFLIVLPVSIALVLYVTSELIAYVISENTEISTGSAIIAPSVWCIFMLLQGRCSNLIVRHFRGLRRSRVQSAAD
mmetsp:Transcript_40167/g.92924  ORF Transcript_40167/g.92924 Transcript_40167/m.92924 type:complete len:528 (-) Transcript_40167:140-1723(-)